MTKPKKKKRDKEYPYRNKKKGKWDKLEENFLNQRIDIRKGVW